MKELTNDKQDEGLLFALKREELGVNILLGFMTSILGIFIIGGVFLEGNLLFEKIIDHISSVGVVLQFLPVVFVLFAEKSYWLKNYWIAIYWLTILLELALITILMMF